jgi:hypothetical protein
MGARYRGGIGLSYRPTRLLRLAEFIPWNRFLGSINVKKYGLRAVLSPLQLALIYVFMHDTSIYMSRTYSYREHTVQCTVQYTGYMFNRKNRNIIFDEFLVFGP